MLTLPITNLSSSRSSTAPSLLKMEKQKSAISVKPLRMANTPPGSATLGSLWIKKGRFWLNNPGQFVCFLPIILHIRPFEHLSCTPLTEAIRGRIFPVISFWFLSFWKDMIDYFQKLRNPETQKPRNFKTSFSSAPCCCHPIRVLPAIRG